ncbi:hypothetical protein HBA55_14800 [Pseudomaricurvus alkylphenolicus]|uniref:hypothetical protein n=1 Tax=Pseudomaricurvus alkylphenolicus TaxID=1306991 RepID=UPI00141ECD4D|nr:hypothetical protein [Pseudomaricurvus alkylphenolicus]NIB40868.1 hypothetical protein [Pseudomaricurvus alkylphenolicus]
MTLLDLINKTCLIGLSYFDLDGELLKQSQLCGTVIGADEEQGISVQLQGQPVAEGEKPPVFILPPNLSPWFIAPEGHYKNAESGVDIQNPDYLVTWDIYKTVKDTPEGEHEWWEWVPRTAPPQVGA